MSHLFHRDLRRDLPVAMRGEGIYLIDNKGRRYLDASGGGAVCSLGHGDADVIAAMKAQLDRLAYVPNYSLFSNEQAEAAAELLARAAPPELNRTLFLSGGSEAVEAALKIARQFFVETGEPERTVVVSRRHSFHGNTLATVALAGNPARRALFGPFLIDVKQVSPCYAYRGQGSGETEEAYGERAADELAQLAEQLGPKKIAAFIAETVVGGTLGAVPPVPGYFRRIREICDRYGILLILDEVMCGMGRTGTLFAFEQEGIVPDLVCLSKSLGGGYQPVAAVMVSQRIRDGIAAGSGLVQHSHTYQAHPVACAAARAVLEKITQPAMLAQVRERGEQLQQRLRERLAQHPHVGDIRGRGLLIGLEFVRDRETKEPFDPERRINAALTREAMRLGLTVTAFATISDCVMVAPPFIVTRDDVDRIADLLGQAVEAALARPGTA